MSFSFEEIKHCGLSDYLQAIEDYPEFVAKEQPEGFTVITYNMNMPDSFIDPDSCSDDFERRQAIMRLDCRGIKFDTKTGKILSRPYHKFFNVGEHSLSNPDKIDWNKPHVILEKLDGSFITPVLTWWLDDKYI